MHRDFWNNSGEDYNKRECFCENRSTGFAEDPDLAVILPLILLLVSDGGDEMLIMALIYILT